MTKKFIEENYLTTAGRLKPNLGIDKSIIYLSYHNQKETICKYCNKKAKFVSFTEGFKDTCCSKSCLSEQNKEKQKKAKRPNKEKAINEYSEKCLQSEYWEVIGDYISYTTPIKHKCRFCGDIKNISPKATARNGKGVSCKICAKKKYLELENLNYLEELDIKNIDVSPLEPIKGRDSKSLHLCSCGNKWEIKPYDVLRGIHCYECSGGLHTDRFYLGKETILYYVEISGLWKIGITLFRGDIESSLKRRFNTESYKLIFSRIYKNGAEAYYQEQDILESNAGSKYNSGKIIKAGYTEMFSEDISEKILSIFTI